jgi:ribonuclease Z
MQLHFLGTGAGMPSKERNTSSVLLELYEQRGTAWMFDCGEATQHQILKTSIKPRKIEKIFITHLHGDHIFGLPGLLSSRSFLAGEDTLTIYGPPGIKAFIDMSLSISNTHIKYPLVIEEIGEGIIFEDEQFVVTAKLLQHIIPTFGYRIEQKNMPGELLIDKALALGVPKGPLLKQLKNGKNVVLEDGSVVNSSDVVGAAKKGTIITILGDTKYCEASIELASGADVLVHESTFDHHTEDLAASYGHSTNTEAATVAKKAGVKALILNHISARFLGKDVDNLLTQAHKIFQNTFIAVDFSRYELKDIIKREK